MEKIPPTSIQFLLPFIASPIMSVKISRPISPKYPNGLSFSNLLKGILEKKKKMTNPTMKKISCLGANVGEMLERVRMLNNPKNKIIAGIIHTLMV